ncbi:hypothetical protein GUJ93_ZPchr0014g46587 [Zizania palustris]|uniref:Uncharacterized protein n=1 Tax=Zizania palustris TaxID=103762 RepID=A0A8J5SV64_ZIZPA|nr:hypothetical protein GUJ93_ZPchr0014g46587 [Zizania palustris]
MLLSIPITFQLRSLTYQRLSLRSRSSHDFPIAFALTETLIKSQTFSALATTPLTVSPVTSSGSSLHGVVLPAEEEQQQQQQQQEGSASAAALLVLACACASSDGGVKLPSFERNADLQGQATGERSSQPFLGVLAEGARAAVSPVASAQLRRPREPAADDAMKVIRERQTVSS